MPPKGSHRNNPRILEKDIITYIASNSDLTKEQVKKVFSIFADMVADISCSPYLDKNTTIIFPKLGKFYYRTFQGKKAGTYKMPYYTGKGNKNTTKELIIEEDTPETYKLAFRVRPTIAMKAKKVQRGDEEVLKEILYNEKL